jgi:hypothetical protein
LFTHLSKPNIKKLALFLINDYGELPYRTFHGFHEILGLGVKRGSNLFLKADERSQIKVLFERQVGDLIGLLTITNETDRLTTQSLVHDEKFSNALVAINDIRLFSYADTISINNECYKTPLGGHLTVQYTDELIINHTQIVVCENLAPFINLHCYKHLLPESLYDAVFVYRGNGTSVSGVYKLCESTDAVVGVMSDLDLAGLVIANTIPNVRFSLYPDEADLLGLCPIQQPQLWVKQFALHSCAEKYTKDTPLEAHFTYLALNSSGITQEGMFTSNASLKVINSIKGI